MSARVYLAGPDVFLPNPKAHADVLKTLCRKYDLEGVFPLDAELALDGLNPREQARAIFHANVDLIRSCQGVLANMTPFRGPSMDVGTAWEVGFAHALGLPIVGYTVDGRPYPARVREYVGDFFDENMTVEDFGLVDNLMIDMSIITIVPDFTTASQRIREALMTPKVPCECADALNFGEPQPDCTACGGSGRRPKDKLPDGPIFKESSDESPQKRA